MPSQEIVIEIDAPPERVWEFVSDTARYSEWIEFVRELVEVSDSPLRACSTYRERAKPGPRESVYEWRIEEWDAPRRQVHSHASFEMDARLEVALEPSNGGTRMWHRMEYRMFPKLRPLGWLLERAVVRRKMRADMERFLGNAKRIIEREQSEAPSGEEQP